MKKVLVISYYWPPLAGSSVQRTLKFVKFLPRYGWRPVVLIPRNPCSGNVEIDETLLDDIPDEAAVYESASMEVDRIAAWLGNKLKVVGDILGKCLPGKSGVGQAVQWRFEVFYNRLKKHFVPDHKVGWFPGAFAQAGRIIRENNISLIYSTSPYAITHLIAYALKLSYKIPWVSDYRDPWTQELMDPITGLTKKFNEKLEKRFLKSADMVITVVEEIKQGFLDKYVKLDSSKFQVIPNGYDPDDFKMGGFIHDEVFKITYAGRFHKERRSPNYFLCAFRKLLDKYPELIGKVKVQFVGNVQRDVAKDIADLGLESSVDILKYRSHRESCGILMSSDCLLLILSRVKGGEYIMTGKIFEYLYAKKPILAVIPEGAAAGLIRQLNAGTIVSPDNVDEIASGLYNMYLRFGLMKEKFLPEYSGIGRFNRCSLAGELARVFDNLAG